MYFVGSVELMMRIVSLRILKVFEKSEQVIFLID